MIDFLPTLKRQKQILSLLARQRGLSVTENVRQFSISEATARRDLESLTLQGEPQRVHSGDVAVEPAPTELPIHEQESEQLDEKRRIGGVASSLVADNETLFMGSGTTDVDVARNLREHKILTVITNSLP